MRLLVVVSVIILIDANRFNGPSSKRHDDDDNKDDAGIARRDSALVMAVNTDRRIFTHTFLSLSLLLKSA